MALFWRYVLLRSLGGWRVQDDLGGGRLLGVAWCIVGLGFCRRVVRVPMNVPLLVQ